MDRRTMLAAAGLAGLATRARAQTRAAMPGAESNGVWLVGDTAPGSPIDDAAQLSWLAAGHKDVGDSYLQHGAVAELERAFAALTGKEDCAFFATGTLANNVALRVLCGENRRAIVQHESHLYRDESDAAARLAGITLVPLGVGQAMPPLADFVAAIDAAEKGPYPLRIGAISLECPVRRAEGKLVPLAEIRAVSALARAHGTGLHLDAARLLLAPPSFDARACYALFDTVYVSLYKYLGAPFGAVLAGSKAHIAAARDWRHVYGGLIHQGWHAALPALDALPGFPARIAAAHAAADRLIAMLEASGRIRRMAEPNASNIHFLEMSEELAKAAQARGRAAAVRIGGWRGGRVPLYVNETIVRRPVHELARLFLG